jgi:hypothetical protein
MSLPRDLFIDDAECEPPVLCPLCGWNARFVTRRNKFDVYACDKCTLGVFEVMRPGKSRENKGEAPSLGSQTTVFQQDVAQKKGRGGLTSASGRMMPFTRKDTKHVRAPQ